MSLTRTVRAFPLIGFLALALALVCGIGPAIAQSQPSSADDRSRFVSITRALEQAPLRPDAQADRAWALDWLIEAPDVSVTACPDYLGEIDEDYPYGGEVLLQYVFSMAVLIIEQPATANDPNAQQLAGVEGALRAYRAIIAAHPDSRSPAFDSLLAIEARGGLPEFILAGAESCSGST